MSATLGVMLLAVAATSMAGERNTAHIESCKSEVLEQYGADREVMVVSERRIASGLQVRLATRMDQNTTRFVNCWVPNNSTADGRYAGLDTVAARLEPQTAVVTY
jgi:hypothetical protein